MDSHPIDKDLSMGTRLGTGEGFVCQSCGLAGLGVGEALAFAVEDQLGVRR